MQTRHDELLSELVALGARISAAEHRHLTLIRELGKCTNPWGGTFAEWIAWRCHMELKSAYEAIRVADALENLPVTDKLFSEGRLAYSKVRIITRYADARTDEVFAGHALLMTVRQLNHLVRQYKKVLPQEAIAVSESRYLRVTEHEDGGFVLRAKLTAEQGALVIKALEAAMNAGGAADSREQANVDALVEMATAALGQLATGDAAKLQVRTDVLPGQGGNSTRGDKSLLFSRRTRNRGPCRRTPRMRWSQAECSADAGAQARALRDVLASDVHAQELSARASHRVLQPRRQDDAEQPHVALQQTSSPAA